MFIKNNPVQLILFWSIILSFLPGYTKNSNLGLLSSCWLSTCSMWPQVFSSLGGHLVPRYSLWGLGTGRIILPVWPVEWLLKFSHDRFWFLFLDSLSGYVLGVSPLLRFPQSCLNYQTLIIKSELGHHFLCEPFFFPTDWILGSFSICTALWIILSLYFQLIFSLEMIIVYNYYFLIIFALFIFDQIDFGHPWE